MPLPPADLFHEFVYSSVLSPGLYVLDPGAAIIDKMAEFPPDLKDDDRRSGRRFLAHVVARGLLPT